MHVSLSLSRIVLAALLVFGGWASALQAAEPDTAKNATFSAEQLDFFEKQVRPLLVNRCYECHSGESKELQGGLRVDSRAALLAGGDTGPAVVPGDLKESLLIGAINYGDLYQMPPKSKMPAAEIAVLTKWVEMGAPWPAGEAIATAEKRQFDLDQRTQDHWAWRKIARPPVPAVKNAAWPSDDLDRFILARLEAQRWQPAERADRPTLLRRVYFDLTGLPPTPAEAEAFLTDDSPQAYAKLIDRLLDSPRFGERWGRHWLDLVRYAESRGHEFDYDAPNAWQYRDYVIRALNADVPYDQFVTEHLAGDLMPQPRTDPATGANESILGTGFWFLGDWLHSPVDTRQDEAERYDNMIDVVSKTFLGMTVACARCHDHKFDAIAQSDYYALAGFLQSTTYRQVRFESMLANRQVNEELAKLREEFRPQMMKQAALGLRPVGEQLDHYLLAAAKCIAAGPLTNAESAPAEELVIADFESGTYDGWEVTGDAFGPAPQTLETIAPYQGKINGTGKYFVNSHDYRTKAGKGDESVGTLLSPPFTVERDYITLWVGGGAQAEKTCVNLLIDGKAVRTATGRNNNQMVLQSWQVSDLRGKQARIEIVDRATGGWGNVGVDQIVQTDYLEEADKSAVATLAEYRSRCEAVAGEESLDAEVLLHWTAHLLDPRERDTSPLAAWVRMASGLDVAKTEEMLSQLIARRTPTLAEILQSTDVVIDYSRVEPAKWLVDGPLFGSAAVPAGTAILASGPARPIERFVEYGTARRDPFWNGLRLADGTQNDPGRTSGWVRAGMTIRTPTFTIGTPSVYILMRGKAHAYAEVDSHRVNQGPLHGSLIREIDTGEKLQWVGFDLRRYLGHGAHLEFSAAGEHPLEILAVVQAEQTPPLPQPNLAGDMAAQCQANDSREPQALAAAIRNTFAVAIGHIEHDTLKTPSQMELANWILEHRQLFAADRPAAAEPLAAVFDAYAERLQELSAERILASHTALAMWEGNAVDERLFIRGNHKTLGETVPRGNLTALAGEREVNYGAGSGRLELARQWTSPENPLLSRVMVNRIWHHLFGHGIVRSVDNFGVLGEEPSHAELLDHLAVRFMQDGWSVKRLIRTIALSSSYQMASSGSEAAAEAADPSNKLLHRQNIRRLEGESIRDSILAVSGRLNSDMYGPSVPIHLTPFMEGRGRPGSGPLDGNGRRSIYLSVRRNFLSPMMLAFDTPIPFTTVGRRNVSNVPAQALILLNDPFVFEEANRWAKQAIGSETDSSLRIGLLYRQAFARDATEREIAAAMAFLGEQGAQYSLSPEQAAGDQRVWTDLCHVLINSKEFVFIR